MRISLDLKAAVTLAGSRLVPYVTKPQHAVCTAQPTHRHSLRHGLGHSGSPAGLPGLAGHGHDSWHRFQNPRTGTPATHILRLVPDRTASRIKLVAGQLFASPFDLVAESAWGYSFRKSCS